MILLLNNDGPKGVKGATEEDKKELNGLYEMGLMDPDPWPAKGKPDLCNGPLWINTMRKLDGTPNINRILAQSGFYKIRALTKTFLVRKIFVHHT